MAARASKARAFYQLWAAHRELTELEWLECRRTIQNALIWIVFAAIAGVSGWLALNACVVIAFSAEPIKAAIAVTGMNLAVTAVAAWQAVRLLRRPFFALTRREAARDVNLLLRGAP